MRGWGKGGRWGWNWRSGSTGGWGRAMRGRGWGSVDGSRRWRGGVVGVVEGVLGRLIVLDSGEVDTAPLEENQRERNVSGSLL